MILETIYPSIFKIWVKMSLKTHILPFNWLSFVKGQGRKMIVTFNSSLHFEAKNLI